jgi:hypothetical protein
MNWEKKNYKNFKLLYYIKIKRKIMNKHERVNFTLAEQSVAVA